MMAADVGFYLGFWTNWTGGQIPGATLTLSLQQGTYLVAFLAIYVSLVGVHTWQILSYFAFRAKTSTSERSDVLSRRQLLILRNILSDLTAGWELACAAWKERKKGKGVARSVILIFAAILHGIAFAAAGILASRVTGATAEVLLRSNLCGVWNPTAADSRSYPGSASTQVKWNAEQSQRVLKSAQFVTECYNSTSLADCNMFGPRLAKYTTSTRTDCLFDPSMCLQNIQVTLDSGDVDSLYDFGINSRPSDRITFRKTTECSPIVTEGFTKVYTSRNLDPSIAHYFGEGESLDGSTFTAFYYGENLVLNQKPTFIFDNSTMAYSSGSNFSGGSDSASYQVNTESAWPSGQLWGSFHPIPQLSQQTGILLLLFLAKAVWYMSPVLDPWFEADSLMPPNQDWAITSYVSRPPVSVLGCISHTQVCNPVSQHAGKCMLLATAETSSFQLGINEISDQLSLNAAQRSVLSRFDGFITDNIHLVLKDLSGQGLLAFENLDGGWGTSLPENQWILELQHAFSILLTYFQLSTMEYVTGLQTASINQFIQAPAPSDQWMCDNQIVQRNDHASFSVLGLGIILVVGTLIVIFNSLLSTIWPRVRKRSFLDDYCNAQWKLHELQELQPGFVEEGERIDDRKQSSAADSTHKGLTSIFRSVWREKRQYTDVETEEPKNNFLCDSSLFATIDMKLQQADFPPQELAHFLEPVARA